MDKPTTPAGPNSSDSPWPDNSGSGQDFGATGIFGTMKAPEPDEDLAESDPEPGPLVTWFADPAPPQPAPVPQTTQETWPPAVEPAPAPKAFAEPVVHKVVFGGGAAENSPELLDRMRAASAERAAAEKTPAAETGSKGSGGFTELLRTLSTEPAAPPVAPREAPRPAQESGFTSLLQTLGTSPGAAPAEVPFKPVQPAAPVARTAPEAPPGTPTPGGFTELLRTAAPTDAPESARPQTQGFADSPSGVSAQGEGKPGTFTQLFGSLGGAGTTEPAPPPASSTASAGSSGSGPGAFTRMLSLEQQSEHQSAPAPPFHEVQKPFAGSSDYGAAPRNESPASGLDPFASPLPEAPQAKNTPAGSGAGITRLIQMLDEPSKAPAPHFDPAPVSPPTGPEPGAWTQTFASLAESNKPAMPPANTPDWSSPPPPATPAYQSAPAYPASNAPVPNPPSVSSAGGPSEFTRILDASKMRELSMQGGAAVTNPASVPAPPQSFTPPTPQVPMPNFPMPAAPPPMAMPGMGGMPHPGSFAPPQPPQVPNYPMNFGPQAGGMPPMGGSLPQAPGMYAPTVPVPPVPQIPPVKPPEGSAGKTQQMLVIMGVVIIVLLVAILVTVIFLMKH